MNKVYCDRCGKEKTKYMGCGYKVLVSHTQLKDLCKSCFNEICKLINDFMKSKKWKNKSVYIVVKELL